MECGGPALHHHLRGEPFLRPPGIWWWQYGSHRIWQCQDDSYGLHRHRARAGNLRTIVMASTVPELAMSGRSSPQDTIRAELHPPHNDVSPSCWELIQASGRTCRDGLWICRHCPQSCYRLKSLQNSGAFWELFWVLLTKTKKFCGILKKIQELFRSFFWCF